MSYGENEALCATLIVFPLRKPALSSCTFLVFFKDRNVYKTLGGALTRAEIGYICGTNPEQTSDFYFVI